MVLDLEFNSATLYSLGMETLFIGINPRLEAIREGNGSRCAVITHPHPLYGGDMHNNVVLAARDMALERGLSSLRFNFRGVGRSEGVYDNGIGERKDLEIALREAGDNSLVIAYSFGAWVASSIAAATPQPCILIAPPTAMLPFPPLKEADVRVVVGSRDQFCDRTLLDAVIDPEKLTVIDGADHFWYGNESTLKTYLDDVLKSMMDK
ncbi:MAG: hypothetical protein CSYNP_03892 [Syntrophus sp. SKADARSKE-3]|nr:hypothetical protein [Syntrophus sp. SKADARSKE-3]